MKIIEWLKQVWLRKVSLSGLNAVMNDTDFMVEAPKIESHPRAARSSIKDVTQGPVQTVVWKRPAKLRSAGKASIS